MNLFRNFLLRITKWVAVHMMTTYMFKLIKKYFYRFLFRMGRNKFFARRSEMKMHDEALSDMGEELIEEFIKNGFSEEENRIARKIRNYMQKHGLL